jgi:hypothetical protein
MGTFIDEAAKLFWPNNDAYNTELENFIDERVALTTAYADESDSVTDAKAADLLNRRISIQKAAEPFGQQMSQEICNRTLPSQASPFPSRVANRIATRFRDFQNDVVVITCGFGVSIKERQYEFHCC